MNAQKKQIIETISEIEDVLKEREKVFELYIPIGSVRAQAYQTLFWDEIRFEVPKRPHVKLKEDNFLIQLYYDRVEKLDRPVELGYLKTNGLTRDDKETAEKALKIIKRFTRLLALRDQECPASRGYEGKLGKKKYAITMDAVLQRYEVYSAFNNVVGVVYFKTKEDAQKICNILNSGRFDLEEE